MTREILDKLIINAGLEINGNFITLPEWCRRVKIDCGLAFNAPQTAKWLEEDEDLIVFGFEPVKENVTSLRRGIQNVPDIKYVDKKEINFRFFIIEAALGQVTEQKNIYVTKEDLGRSSLLSPLDFEVERIENISVIKLDDFLQYFPFEKVKLIDHLKTDCQGTDYEVLMGAKANLSRIAAITCEVEHASYSGSRNTFENVSNLLTKHGFSPINNSPRHVLIVSQKFSDSATKKLLRRLYKATFRRKYAELSSKVEDPTFINKKYKDAILSGQIKIHQKG